MRTCWRIFELRFDEQAPLHRSECTRRFAGKSSMIVASICDEVPLADDCIDRLYRIARRDNLLQCCQRSQSTFGIGERKKKKKKPIADDNAVAANEGIQTMAVGARETACVTADLLHRLLALKPTPIKTLELALEEGVIQTRCGQ